MHEVSCSPKDTDDCCPTPWHLFGVLSSEIDVVATTLLLDILTFPIFHETTLS